MGSLYVSGSEYRVGSGDLIQISVFGVEFTHSLRIDSSGRIKVPLLGPMIVAGMTVRELEQQLESILTGDYFHDPQVSAVVTEYRSQPVYILGAVVRPGQYQLVGRLQLIDLLAMAGGLAPNAADELTIQRRYVPPDPLPTENPSTADPKDRDRIQVNLEELLENGDLSLNLPIQGGDVINVPEEESEVYYVIGEVTAAGAFAFPEDAKLLISQALAQAGGPMKTAKMGDGLLVRYDNDGTRRELAVDFTKILKGQRPDFPVEPDDIIFIPGSNFKTITYGLLGVIPGAVTSSLPSRR